MAAYAHADHVVGLDVDRDQVCLGGVHWGSFPEQWLGCRIQAASEGHEQSMSKASRTHRQMPAVTRPAPPLPQYDKFHLRGCIDALLMELWHDPTCGQSLTAAAQSRGSEAGAVHALTCSLLPSAAALSTARGAERRHCPAANVWWQPGAFHSPAPLPSTSLRSAVCRLCGCGAERPHVPAQGLAAGGRGLFPCPPPALRLFSASQICGLLGKCCGRVQCILQSLSHHCLPVLHPHRGWRTSTRWRSARRTRRGGSRCRRGRSRRSRWGWFGLGGGDRL